MTQNETIVLALDIFALLIVNLFMFFNKKALFTSKYLWIYFTGVKLTIVLPAILTGLQMYVYAFGYVPKVGSAMHYLIMYIYIGYLLIAGFVAYMEENQVNLLRFMSFVTFVYQCYMFYQILNNKWTMQIMGDSAYNLWRYGDTMGYILAGMGPFLSFLGFLTAWNYWVNNKKQSFQ